jgi:pSer/pThr/pTyr-binding forkhead associated (FHA) protein
MLLPELETVVMRGLEKDPKKRFASVEAFAQAFSQALWSTSSLRCSFRVERGKEVGRIYETSQPMILIGRGRTLLDINLPDPQVARTHAGVSLLKDGEYAIQDFDHLIQVNERHLELGELTPLQDGDRVQIGQTVLVFSQQRFDTIPLEKESSPRAY